MKYFTFVDLGDNGREQYHTFSEDEIIDSYYDYWYSQIVKKFGKAHVDQNYSRQDCIDDWVVVNWAWEVDKPCE